MPSLQPVRRLGGGKTLLAAALSPDGRLAAGGGADGTVRLWEVPTGKPHGVLHGHRYAVTSVSFSPDGRFLVSASLDHDVRIWSVAGGSGTSPLKPLRGHGGPVFGASFNPDGHLIVSAGPSRAGVWNSATGSVLLYLHAGAGHLTSAEFSPDGRRIVTSGIDGTVRGYDCRFCGNLEELVGAARARLAELARPLAPADRHRYLPEAAS